MQQYEQAVQDYSKAIELTPNYPEAYNNIGNICRILEDYTLAIEYYNEAIHLNPNFAMAYHNRGIAYMLLGNAQNANTDFSRAKELGYTD